jgi:hypothetical protein
MLRTRVLDEIQSASLGTCFGERGGRDSTGPTWVYRHRSYVDSEVLLKYAIVAVLV